MSDIRHFETNAFNIRSGALRTMPIVQGYQHKGRGVVAMDNIPNNTIVCLFPGEEIYRYPNRGTLPREDWPKRTVDEKLLDAQETSLPISDYAIRVSVLDFDEGGNEIGYHWRILDPMADDAQYDRLLQQLKNTSLEPSKIAALPDGWTKFVENHSRLLYSKLCATKRIPNKSVATDENERFYITRGMWSPELYVVIRIDTRFHYVCLLNEIKSEETVLHNIKLALNTTFNPRSTLSQQILQAIKKLRLPDDYPYMGAFINQPYDFEAANLRFVDPHEWISNIRTKKWASNADLSSLVDDDLKHTDLLQRQALLSRRFIKAGEELLVKYNRTQL